MDLNEIRKATEHNSFAFSLLLTDVAEQSRTAARGIQLIQ
jgi:hypothetical protein